MPSLPSMLFRRSSFATLLIAGAVSACALLAGCGESAEKTAVAAPPAPPILQGKQLRFPTGHPQLALLNSVPSRPATDIVADLPARLVWNEERTQRIYPAFGGRVVAIGADIGAVVKPGSVLARLASPDFGAAQSDTTKAGVDVNLARKVLARQRELFDAGIIARKDLEQTEADLARAQAESARAAARTTLYGAASSINQQLGLTSGIAGVVVERNINPGQEVRPDQSGPGAPALFVVTDPSSLWVLIDAKEIDIGSMQPGTTFELQVPAYPGETFTGRVIATSDSIDPGTRTIKVRGVIANTDRRLKSEMLVTARVREKMNGVVVPATAIVLERNQHKVFVQVQPGVFEPRMVTMGHMGNREVVLSSGLAAGEQVVADNALLLAREFSVAMEDAGNPTSPQANQAK
ncbi:efflux RND transporter periplasmic adaptor subunit [Xylophilus sp. GOD-11R]|uniref:efflux RND transporter periplasmic adaptor subunit n=1 Tax=Xylophilus sp. GOD-11R TaxID=3089814 RepID=UPI00298BCCD8|nr:efflux RND transporter periplasmic adaptor subunit [Xylophilus sp. GOD-11R]WPB56983.1 efflux RND transporter periplasmic adaptor subunit [Xylophilus sp. GOD-11R]